MKRLFTLMSLILILLANGSNTNDPGFELYSKGYLNIINENWEKSIADFKSLVEKYPDSEYADDATFWTAYSYKELGEFITSFDTFYKLINKYPDSNLFERGIDERISIAKLLANKNNQRFITFLKSGGDISDELIQKYNKLKLFKQRIFDLDYQKQQLVTKMNMIQLRERNTNRASISIKTTIDNDRKFSNDTDNPERVAREALTYYYKIQTMNGEIEYHSKIAAQTENEIDLIIRKFDPYLTDDNIAIIVDRFNSINQEFYTAYKFVEKQDWVSAKKQFLTFIEKYPDHSLVKYAEYWLSYSYKENSEYAISFKTFGNLINKTSDKYIIEESKYNRIIIANTLAQSGNQEFVKFLEEGSDYKDEINQLYSELIKITDEDTQSKLNRLFTSNNTEVREKFDNTSSVNANENQYKHTLLSRLNIVAEKIKPFYGTYKINLLEIVK